MINNQDKDIKEIEAMELIDQAEVLIDKGDGENALKLYEKAAQIYLDFSYIKLDQIYIRIAKIISRFKDNIQAAHRLESIIRKTEQLKLYEISAKLLMQLANVAYKMNDWETAGESWQRASSYFHDADPEEYNTLSSFLLLKAGQVYERSRLTKDQGKRLILQAIMKISKFDELYDLEEKRGLNLLIRKQYGAAANKFYDIATYFMKALDDMGEFFDEKESSETYSNIKARLIHFIAEYKAVSAFCLRVSENRLYNEKIKELCNESINLFKQSIMLLKDNLLTQKAKFDRELLMRITFDTMMLALIQTMIGIHKINPNEYLVKNCEQHKELTEKLQQTPYYKITERIEKIGIVDALNEILKVNLGHFEEIKNNLISYFLEK